MITRKGKNEEEDKSYASETETETLYCRSEQDTIASTGMMYGRKCGKFPKKNQKIKKRLKKTCV